MGAVYVLLSTTSTIQVVIMPPRPAVVHRHKDQNWLLQSAQMRRPPQPHHARCSNADFHHSTTNLCHPGHHPARHTLPQTRARRQTLTRLSQWQPNPGAPPPLFNSLHCTIQRLCALRISALQEKTDCYYSFSSLPISRVHVPPLPLPESMARPHRTVPITSTCHQPPHHQPPQCTRPMPAHSSSGGHQSSPGPRHRAGREACTKVCM